MSTGWQRGSDFEADSSQIVVQINAVYEGEKLVAADGKPLPRLKSGARVSLRMRLNDIADPELARSLHREEPIVVLPAGTRLLGIVRSDPDLRKRHDAWEIEQHLQHSMQSAEVDYLRKNWAHLEQHAHWRKRPSNVNGAVDVMLLQPLTITLRGYKLPTLAGCPCVLPYLEKEAYSLNHAATLISEHFEGWRISHTANAFLCFFFERDGVYRRLDELVAEAEAQSHARHENRSTSPSARYPGHPSPWAELAVSQPVTPPADAFNLPALFEELAALCKAGLAWAKRNGYPEVEAYPQYARAREIGEVLHRHAGFAAMQQAVRFVVENVTSRDGGQAALLEYGWNGIGGWRA